MGGPMRRVNQRSIDLEHPIQVSRPKNIHVKVHGVSSIQRKCREQDEVSIAGRRFALHRFHDDTDARSSRSRFVLALYFSVIAPGIYFGYCTRHLVDYNCPRGRTRLGAAGEMERTAFCG